MIDRRAKLGERSVGNRFVGARRLGGVKLGVGGVARLGIVLGRGRSVRKVRGRTTRRRDVGASARRERGEECKAGDGAQNRFEAPTPRGTPGGEFAFLFVEEKNRVELVAIEAFDVGEERVGAAEDFIGERRRGDRRGRVAFEF